MSLSRFLNKTNIIESKTRVEGLVLRQDDLSSIARDISIIDSLSGEDVYVEGHVYNLSGEYITSNYRLPYEYSLEYKDFTFNVADLFDDLNLVNGSYKISFSFLKTLFGSFESQPIVLQEISPDATEIKLYIKESYIKLHPEIIDKLKEFRDTISIIKAEGKLNNLVVNFLNNRIHQIVNIKIDCETEQAIYLKLYEPLSGEIVEKQPAFIAFKLLEDYVDTFALRPVQDEIDPNVIAGPDFEIFDDDLPIETGIEYWNSLLDTQTQTQARLINQIFSGSSEIELNLDWTDFANFVVYGSAQERVKNYKHKLELIEYYYTQKSQAISSNASGSASIQEVAQLYTDRSNKIIGGLDPFESHLYYETGSLFSYDLTGSIKPHPKYVQSGKYINYPTTSSIFTTWYNSLLSTAQTYDRTNYSSFFYNTPDHILRDPNNSQYVLFIHMIGQHFDNLYAYVRKLTSIHVRDEHPQRGIPNKLLPHYARSLGWKLSNNKSLSDLWLYKLGTDISGSYSTPSGSMVSKPHEVLSEQIWRRVVNNLPFLLKTKGTTRSIRALFSIYGIPFTLISVKEYGGPAPEGDTTSLIEDRFQYVLNLYGNEYIELTKNLQLPAEGDTLQIPQTTEFRFKTNYITAPSMSLWAVEETSNRPNPLQHLEIVHHSGSLYGKNTYGYLKYSINTGSSGTAGMVWATSSLLPLYDNDLWTVRMYTNQPVYLGSTFDGKIYIDVAKASDFVDGQVSLSSSFNVEALPARLLYSLGAVSANYVVSASISSLDIDFSPLFPAGRKAIVQTHDSIGDVIEPLSIKHQGSLVNITFNSEEQGGIFAVPGVPFSSSFTSGSEVLISHNLNTYNLLAQYYNQSGYVSTANKIRLVDQNTIGVTTSITETGSINIAYSGSLSDVTTVISRSAFALGTQVTQSNPFGTDSIIVQVFDTNNEQIIPENIKISGNIYVDFISPESGSIHVGKTDVISLLDSPHSIVLGGTTGSDSIRFSGSIQAYREYYDTFSRTTFDNHVLNPGGYFGNSYTSSYHGLYRYYPLGLDNMKHDHSTYTVVSSSHPNQNRTSETNATFYNFTGSEARQYSSFTEVYYTKYPSLGANNPKSLKIRSEDAVLTRQLSPDQKSERGKFDYAQPDTNRLAVVFSPTDQINRDISNQFGPYNFQNFVGDPEHETKSYYPDLNVARDAYFKKFAASNDISKYIEIFSLYDYAVFEQIKQLIPGRSNLISGVLLEPTLLERPKHPRTQPSIIVQDNTTLLQPRYKNPTGSIQPLSTLISTPVDIEIERSKEEVTIPNPLDIEIERSKEEVTLENPLVVEIERSKTQGSIMQVYDITGSLYSNNILGNSLSSEISTPILPDGNVYSGTIKTGSITYTCKIGGEIKTKTIKDNSYTNHQAVIPIIQDHHDFDNTIYNNTDRAVGYFTVETSSGAIPFNLNYLEDSTYLFYVTSQVPRITSSIELNGTAFNEFINKYDYKVFNNSNIIYRSLNRGKVHYHHISGSRTYSTYNTIKYYYSSSGAYGNNDYLREKDYATQKELGLFHSSSLKDANYQHFEESRIGGCRFAGSKLTALDFNKDSTDSVTGGPIVTITNVNSNQIII